MLCVFISYSNLTVSTCPRGFTGGLLFPRRAVRGSLAAGRPIRMGRGGAGLAAVAGALPCPAYYRHRPGLRCVATRLSWLLMVSRLSGCRHRTAAFTLPFVRREGVRGWVPGA